MPTVLITEDDENLRLLLTQRLKHKYRIFTAENGIQALKVVDKDPIDLLVTDITMPFMDGFELVETIRKREMTFPVLMLTADQSFQAKKKGFALGTDDYLTKPFDKEELIWRIEALLRRAKINNDQKISFGSVTINLSSFTLTDGEKSFTLPAKEFKLLYKLLSEPGRIFTKNQLFDDIWGFDSDSGDDTVKTHISRLRNKIKEIPNISIIAVKGIGYKAEVKER